MTRDTISICICVVQRFFPISLCTTSYFHILFLIVLHLRRKGVDVHIVCNLYSIETYCVYNQGRKESGNIGDYISSCIFYLGGSTRHPESIRENMDGMWSGPDMHLYLSLAWPCTHQRERPFSPTSHLPSHPGQILDDHPSTGGGISCRVCSDYSSRAKRPAHRSQEKEKEMKSKDRQRQKLFEAGGLGDSLASGFVTPSSISSSSLCLDVQSGVAAGLSWALCASDTRVEIYKRRSNAYRWPSGRTNPVCHTPFTHSIDIC